MKSRTRLTLRDYNDREAGKMFEAKVKRYRTKLINIGRAEDVRDLADDGTAAQPEYAHMRTLF